MCQNMTRKESLLIKRTEFPYINQSLVLLVLPSVKWRFCKLRGLTFNTWSCVSFLFFWNLTRLTLEMSNNHNCSQNQWKLYLENIKCYKMLSTQIFLGISHLTINGCFCPFFSCASGSYLQIGKMQYHCLKKGIAKNKIS